MAASAIPSGLSAQVARISQRERRLLLILAFAALIVAPVLAFQRAQTAGERNLAAHAEFDKQLQAQRSALSGGVGGQMLRQRAEIKDWSWPASTAQVGKVLAQDRIAAIAAAGGLTGAEVKAADKIEHAGGVDLARIDIDAPFTWRGLSGFLAGLAETKKGFLVDALTIDDAASPHLKMTLKLPMAAPAPVAAEPAA